MASFWSPESASLSTCWCPLRDPEGIPSLPHVGLTLFVPLMLSLSLKVQAIPSSMSSGWTCSQATVLCLFNLLLLWVLSRETFLCWTQTTGFAPGSADGNLGRQVDCRTAQLLHPSPRLLSTRQAVPRPPIWWSCIGGVHPDLTSHSCQEASRALSMLPGAGGCDRSRWGFTGGEGQDSSRGPGGGDKVRMACSPEGLTSSGGQAG